MYTIIKYSIACHDILPASKSLLTGAAPNASSAPKSPNPEDDVAALPTNGAGDATVAFTGIVGVAEAAMTTGALFGVVTKGVGTTTGVGTEAAVVTATLSFLANSLTVLASTAESCLFSARNLSNYINMNTYMYVLFEYGLWVIIKLIIMINNG